MNFKIPYLSFGENNKEQCVFLHGNGFPPESYHSLLQCLSKRINIYAMYQKPFSPTTINPNSINGWEIFKDYPLTGCGFRCVDLVNSYYPDPTGHVKNIRGMHNNFIQLAVDTGILGLVSWVGIWLCFYRLLYRQLRDSKTSEENNWVIFGSAAATLGFLAGGFFESNFYDSEVVMVLYFIMAFPFACYPSKLAKQKQS